MFQRLLCSSDSQDFYCASGGFHEIFACFGTSTTVEERLLNEKSAVVGKRRHTSFTSNHERNNKQLSKKCNSKKSEKEQQKKSDKFLKNVDLMHWISSKSK